MKVKVIGRRYSAEAKFYKWDSEKRYPNFDKVEDQTWEIEADTLKDGVKWLAENHPEMYMGGNIICENGDFVCLAVPCEEYGKGNYETTSARIETARREAAGWN